MSTNKGKNSEIWYLALGALGLYLAWIALKFIYYILSYLATNLFIGLDQSVYGQLSEEPWVGYGFLGLVLGAAAGAIAAQRRFRLNKMITAVSIITILVLCSFAFVGNQATTSIPASPIPDNEATEEATSEENVTPQERSSVESYVDNSIAVDSQTVSEDVPSEVTLEDSAVASSAPVAEPEKVEVDDNGPAVTFTKEEVVEKIKSYYSAVNSYNFEAHDFFAPNVKRYIKSTGMTPGQINNLQRDYLSEFANGVYVIDNNTLVPIQSYDGTTHYQYWADYGCFRKSLQKKQSCRIKCEVEIDANGMIVFYAEDYVRNLQFD
ncbi:hypothetical protein [Rufibacter roseolus]|uniref:hypothetical protein n=1 Tax=Rufibacter roseolus TaxID=2817375 RepID=UPI001B3005D3|nr:hypothetical protein [Rufibacter roseolus]